LDGTFESDTDPTNIDLAGPTLSSTDSTPTAANSLAWITLAPDWEGLPSKATFKLVATKTGTVAATTPWARLLPQTLITDAGLSFTSSSSRTVTYTYSAYDGKKVIASATIPLTFGPFNSKVFFVPAPSVPAVETKSSIPVTYNLSNVLDLSNPTLIVSRPGRVDPVSGEIFDPAYTVALSETSGTVNVPVSKLYGAGIYGIGIQWSTYQGYPVYSDFAFVQVAPPATLRPAAPLLSINKSTPGHDLEVPFDTPFQVSWDVRNISKATGAMLEISAPGPAIGGEYESFNNPNGSVRDADGIDTGSVYFASVGTNGTVTINPATAGMTPTFNHVVRVLPVSGSTVVGEAGDVSSVTEDGVVPVDGNPISGFGIDQNGSDGILTTDYIEQPDGTSEAGAVEVFNQSTGQSTHSTKSSKEGYIGPYDVFGGDVALYASDGATNFKTLDPASTFKSGPTFSPPSGVALGSAAENQTNDTGLFIADDTNGTPYVVSTDLLTSTSTTINIQPYLDQSFPAAIAQDTTNNLAYVGFDPSNGNCTSGPGLLTVDVSAQSSSSVTVTGIGNGGAFGVTFDPSQNTVGLLPNCANNVGFYNLKTKSTIVAPIPPLSFTQDGASALYDLVVDPVNHLVLVIDTAPQDIFTNNNGMYSVVVIDEKTGNIVETIEKFGAANNLAFSGGLSASQPSLLINPSQREGWFSSFGFQLQPFTY
jgi:hypothetical protein